MSLSFPGTNNSSFAGLIGRYLRNVSAWAKSRVSRYGLAIGLFVAGALLLAVALAVGTAAAFHFIELRHGIWTAYGVIGGSFAVLAAIALIAGWAILHAKPPEMPSPPSAARLFRHAAAPIAFRLAATAERARASPATQGTGLLAAGAAALLLIGWVATRQKSSLTREQFDR